MIIRKSGGEGEPQEPSLTARSYAWDPSDGGRLAIAYSL